MEEVHKKSRADGSHAGGAPAAECRRGALRVWLVEDHADLREMLAAFITQQPGLKCTRSFASAEALLETLAEERPPDMILMDVNLAGRTGLSAIRPARRLAPTAKVVMMTTFSNSHYELEAYKAGASGFLLKTYEPDEITNTLRQADRTPGARALFPSLGMREPEKTTPPSRASAETKRFDLCGIFRGFCRLSRRNAAD